MIKCITENETNLQAIRPIVNKLNDWNDNKPQPIKPTNEPKTYSECISICVGKLYHQFDKCIQDCFDMFINKYIN